MSLKDITDGVAAQLGSGTPVFLGAQNLPAEAALPRVVFVPTGDKFGPPESLDQDARALWTRFVGCSVHLWHQDVPSVETLINQVIAAIHAVVGPNYHLDGEAGWMDQQGSLSNQGFGYAFHVGFKIPVTDAPSTAATVAAAPQTNQMASVDPTVPVTYEDAG